MKAKILLLVLAATASMCACSPASTPPSAPPAHVSPAPSSVPTDGGDLEADSRVLLEDEAPMLPQWSDSAHVEALARAEGFVRAWARPDLDTSDWFAGISGYLTPAAAEGFMWTDPTHVPATTITGPAKLVGEGTGTSATVAVPTDAGSLQVLLINDQNTWQVASVEPAEAQDHL